MTVKGIKDKVAIIGCDATKFGELWDKGREDLLFEATQGALKDAGIKKEEIEAAWAGIYYYFTGMSGATIEDILRLDGIPITRVENYCASGMDAFRNACFGVVSGAYDVVLACGVEKLMDEGSSGLPGFKIFGHPVLPLPSAPAMFSMAATRCFHDFGWTKEDLARVAVKNHDNGSYHPKAHFRSKITIEQAMKAPMIADPLGRFDCCAMSDGAASLILTRPELAESYAHADDYVIVKSNQISARTNLHGMFRLMDLGQILRVFLQRSKLLNWLIKKRRLPILGKRLMLLRYMIALPLPNLLTTKTCNFATVVWLLKN